MKGLGKGCWQKGSTHSRWSGGRFIGSKGYIYIYKPGYRNTDKHGDITEHVYNFQEHYKCCMLKWGVVHHKDGNKQNNNIENLEGMTKAKHTGLHRKIDMSNRKCLNCNTININMKKNGCWYKHGDKFLCKNCYMKIIYYKNL